MVRQHPGGAQARRLPQRITRPRPRPLRLIAFAAALGAVLSAYVWYLYATDTTGVFCAAGTGCDLVRESRYSRMAGVPLPAFGTLAYLAIVVLATAPLRWRRLPLVAVTAGRVGLSVYQLAVATLVLRTFCTYCVASAMLALAIAAIVASRPSVRRGGRRLLVIGVLTAVAVIGLAAVVR